MNPQKAPPAAHARVLPRATFSSSRLVRLLANPGATSIALGSPAKQDFAERLGQWLRVADAIELHAVLDARATHPKQRARNNADAALAAIADEVARTRAALVAAITRSFDPSAGERRLTFPLPAMNESAVADFSFVPYHRFHLAHQREMELRITPLRARLRETLTRSTPALQTLAALDAVFEKSLAAREYNLLATVPTLLEQRFAQLLAESVQDEGAAPWLHRFRDEMQQVLLAELDLRFEPITGLLAALQSAHPTARRSPTESGSATAHPTTGSTNPT